MGIDYSTRFGQSFSTCCPSSRESAWLARVEIIKVRLNLSLSLSLSRECVILAERPSRHMTVVWQENFHRVVGCRGFCVGAVTAPSRIVQVLRGGTRRTQTTIGQDRGSKPHRSLPAGSLSTVRMPSGSEDGKFLQYHDKRTRIQLCMARRII